MNAEVAKGRESTNGAVFFQIDRGFAVLDGNGCQAIGCADEASKLALQGHSGCCPCTCSAMQPEGQNLQPDCTERHQRNRFLVPHQAEHGWVTGHRPLFEFARFISLLYTHAEKVKSAFVIHI